MNPGALRGSRGFFMSIGLLWILSEGRVWVGFERGLRAAGIAKHFDVKSGREVEAVFAGQLSQPFGFLSELFASSGLWHQPDYGG
ncbi:MAG: hypothetical protein RLZZ232_1608 [Planctomycetota bacterium]